MTMTSQMMTHHDLDMVDENILEKLINELGLKKLHLSPDPLCFVCRQERYNNLSQRKVEMVHSKQCRQEYRNEIIRR